MPFWTHPDISSITYNSPGDSVTHPHKGHFSNCACSCCHKDPLCMLEHVSTVSTAVIQAREQGHYFSDFNQHLGVLIRPWTEINYSSLQQPPPDRRSQTNQLIVLLILGGFKCVTIVVTMKGLQTICSSVVMTLFQYVQQEPSICCCYAYVDLGQYVA